MADLLHDQAVADGTLLTLVRGPVVEVVHLAFVTLVTHEASAAVTGTVTATLHGDGAHRVAVASWRRRGKVRSGEVERIQRRKQTTLSLADCPLLACSGIM